MANYLWVNPVAEKMYADDYTKVKEQLEELGYVLVSCEPQLQYVREQYKQAVGNADRTVLDCRCPETIVLLEEHDLTHSFDVPKIEPILVRTSRVLYERYVNEETDRLIITCPCTQLRDFTANTLKDKKNLECFTWKEFIEGVGMETLGCIEASPIPLGYFDDTFERVLKLSEKEEILSKIKALKEQEKQYDIVEMLYCKDGCNNGNGI